MTAIGITIAVGVLGFVPLLIAWWKARKVKRLLEKGDIVSGTILSVEERRGYKGSIYYQALIQYPVFNEAPRQGYYVFSGKKWLNVFYKGRKLDICYDKAKPKRFIPREGPGNTWLMWMGVVIAIVYLVICYFLYRELNNAGL